MSWKDRAPLVSDKTFGIVIGLIFLVFALKPLIHHQAPVRGFLLVPVALLVISVFFPRSLRLLNRGWSSFSLFNAAVVREMVSFLVFFGVFAPMGLGLRLLGKDLLRLRWARKKQSYWVRRQESIGLFKNRF